MKHKPRTFFPLTIKVADFSSGGPSLLEISSMIAGNIEIYFRNLIRNMEINLEIFREVWKFNYFKRRFS